MAADDQKKQTDLTSVPPEATDAQPDAAPETDEHTVPRHEEAPEQGSGGATAADTTPPDVSSFLPSTIAQRPSPMPTVGQLAVALGMLVLVFGASYIPGLTDRKASETESVPSVRADTEEAPEAMDDPFTDVSITAEAAYVWDVKNQRALYNKNAGKQLPLASLTKLMTALVAYEHLAKDEQIQITLDAILQDGDSNLTYGEHFSVKDLADLTLVSSSNDGAYALAAAAGTALAPEQDPEATFIEAMNIRAESIGLSQSHFSNPTGLDVNNHTSGGYGSARDMAFLMEYLVLHHPEVIELTKKRSGTVHDQNGAPLIATNTNEVVRDIPGLIGSKTGYTDLAGGNLVVAFDAGLNRPIVISVLGSTRDGRFNDMLSLVKRVQQTIANEDTYGN